MRYCLGRRERAEIFDGFLPFANGFLMLVFEVFRCPRARHWSKYWLEEAIRVLKFAVLNFDLVNRSVNLWFMTHL